ncbi:PA26 p53-induced protein-domain-containing protein [Halteromyces radiatus]|uniref:PA26 p53-induced protein-domain-containing protein n=1 Tax=Halteromyces radiatus TaxID=101107 RepID=UPI00221EC472|nr:PA26 p53-induced protein-domain-containing protein [Halteromyces radiatus]KAI8084711.1 PA26 p53-induced protein-domain-containing protein [Halteromyces radiatus]
MYSDQWQPTSDPHFQEETARDARARRLESSRLRIALFKALQVDSFTERQVSLEKIIQVAKSYMRMAQSPFSPIKSTSTSQLSDNRQPDNSNSTTTKSISQTHDDINAPMTCSETGGQDEELQYFLLTILRLSYTCPFRDVRQTFQQFLKTTLDAGIIPVPQARQLSPSYFIPLQDIFSLESTSSVHNVISYPRPSNLSFSPWSHDASDCGAGSDSIDINKSPSTYQSQQNTHHSHQHHHHQHHSQHSQQHRHSQSRMTPLASSFSSSTSSLLKPSSIYDRSSSERGDHDDHVDTDNGADGDDEDVYSMDDRSSKAYSFTSRGKCTGGRPSDEYVRQMLVKSFLDEGRLTNVYRVISFFPTFYEIFQTTMNNITKTSMGPLHRTWRTYLGIMASAEQQCQYLVSILKLDFLQNGGDPVWLKGIDYCPVKLQRITGFVLKMARQPWRLTEDDLLELMTVSNHPSTSGSSLNMTWSKGELVQAILVISTFLGLGNFVLSCGIAPEMDMYGGYYVRGYDACYGIENELDDTVQLTGTDRHQHHHHQRQRLSMADELAVRAASSATGWYDSHISPKSSEHSQDNSDNEDENKKKKDDIGTSTQPSFVSDKGLGLGVSFDSDEEDFGDDMNDDGQHNNLYLDQTSALISKLKSNKDAVKEELHQSLANLNLFTKMDQQDDEKLSGNTTITTTTTIDTTSNEQHDGKVCGVYEDLTRFTCSKIMKQELMDYEEFVPGHEDYGEYMLSEYCWEDHGCDLVNHFLPGIGNDLDDEFIESLSITDWSIFHQTGDGTVDTSPLRNAIFVYVQQLLGIIKEDYDYEDIPKYLNEQTQRYIQKVCRQPHLLDKNDWNNVGISLRSEEKCHMNLLIASARKQALLCYGLSLVSHV